MANRTSPLHPRLAAMVDRALPQPKIVPDADLNLLEAVEEGRQADALSLLAAGARPTQRDFCGRDPLSIALRGGNARVAAALIPLSDHSSSDAAGATALMHGASRPLTDSAALALLARLGDPKRRDARGNDALCHAAKSGSAATAMLLLPLSDLPRKAKRQPDPAALAEASGRPELAEAIRAARLAAEESRSIGKSAAAPRSEAPKRRL